jgi:hypothetical protein
MTHQSSQNNRFLFALGFRVTYNQLRLVVRVEAALAQRCVATVLFR